VNNMVLINNLLSESDFITFTLQYNNYRERERERERKWMGRNHLYAQLVFFKPILLIGLIQVGFD